MISAWYAIKIAVLRLGASKLWVEGNVSGIILTIKKGKSASG